MQYYIVYKENYKIHKVIRVLKKNKVNVIACVVIIKVCIYVYIYKEK